MYELMKGAFFPSSDKITLRWERITASNNLSIQPIIIYFSVSPSSQVGIGKFIQARVEDFGTRNNFLTA